MSFTCNYCGGTFCSDHRLPENHDCKALEEEIERKKEENEKWFEEKEIKEETTPQANIKKPSLWEDILNTFRNNIAFSIIAVTILFFLLQSLMPGVSPPISEGELDIVLDDPTELNPLTLFPSFDYLIERPWTLLTVMLLHGGIFHLFVNMITFYFFGPPLEKIIGGLRLLKFYIAAGLVASLGYVLFRNLLFIIHGSTLPGGGEVFMPAVGASGAIVAVVGAVAKLYPRAEVLLYFVIPMKIRTAVYAFGAFEVFNIVTALIGHPVLFFDLFASSAHLTGLLVGLWYGNRLKDQHKRDTAVFDPLGY